MLTLGIDIGTSGVRSAILDGGGSVVSMAKAPHLEQMSTHIDAELWWQAVKECLNAQNKALAAKNLALSDVSRIAIDGTSGTMVLTDEHVAPVSPALMYNSKGFVAEAGILANVAPSLHITQGENSALARAMRLASSATSKPVHLLHQADFIAAKLLGQGGNSDTNNCLKTGFDPSTNAWPDWMSEVFDTRLLPEVHDVGDPIGTIDPEIAKQLGLSPRAVVCAGTTDSIAAFLAGAPLENGVAVTSLGSTLAIKMLCNERVDDPKVGLYSHRVRNNWLVGGASNTGGAVLLAHFSPETMAELSELMDTEKSTGLDYYPLLNAGERFPFNDPNLAPRLTPRPAQDHLFLQGMFESIARIEKQCFSAISERGGGNPKFILTAGGGASNPQWTAIRQRVLNVDLRQMEHSEAAIGAARVAQLVP